MTATERQQRWRVRVRYEKLKAEMKELRPKRSMQSTRSAAERGLDAYFTCPQAVICLLHLERAYLPRVILDPCAGAGAFTTLMAQHGYETYANDIKDYGLEGCSISDYLTMAPLPGIEGIATNPPYKKAVEFLQKALCEVGYVALLLRSMWLADADGRDDLLERHPAARTYHLKRLPMMHRHDWAGNRSSSSVPHSLVVWDCRAKKPEPPVRVRWRDHWANYQAGRLDLGPMMKEEAA
jgi:hypothetical protein